MRGGHVCGCRLSFERLPSSPARSVVFNVERHAVVRSSLDVSVQHHFRRHAMHGKDVERKNAAAEALGQQLVVLPGLVSTYHTQLSRSGAGSARFQRAGVLVSRRALYVIQGPRSFKSCPCNRDLDLCCGVDRTRAAWLTALLKLHRHSREPVSTRDRAVETRFDSAKRFAHCCFVVPASSERH